MNQSAPIWTETTIGEQCLVIAGQSPLGKFYNDTGNGLPFYQGKKAFGDKFIRAPEKWTSHTTKEALKGDVLMSVRAPVGPINFSTQKVCIGRGLAAIRTGNGIDNEFLFYALLFKQNEISGNEGAVFASINKKQIENIRLDLPPIPEQKRIVAILEEAFAGISQAVANAGKNLANARELFESYLDNVFTQKGEGWVEKRLSDFTKSISTGPFGSLLHKSDYVTDGVPLVNPTNIVDGIIVPDRKKLIDESTKERLSSYVLSEGDMVIGRRGEIGRCAVVGKSQDG